MEPMPPAPSPDWLGLDSAETPTLRPVEREPWYYGVLETDARVLLGFGVLAFAAIAMAAVFPRLAVSIARGADR